MHYRGQGIRLLEEECALCGEVYPYSALRRCHRCRRFYCRNCFVHADDGQVICLRCARRTALPQEKRSKYAHLSIHLAKRAKFRDYVTLPFAEIEGIIGDGLPPSAYQDKQWWSSLQNRPRSGAWFAGWTVQDVDFDKKIVTFRKTEPDASETSKKRRRARNRPVSKAFKALALKKPRRKPQEPSKTKVAMVLARTKNIERSRSAAYKAKLKPRKAYEKRLYKNDKKPENY